MTLGWKPCVASILYALTLQTANSQTPQFVVLDVEWENGVGYVDNLTDPSRLVTSANTVNVNVRNFMPVTFIADVVSVNGKAVRGTYVAEGRFVMPFPNPMPGQAIGDIGRGAPNLQHVEILQTDGTRIGSIMSAGFAGGPAPPGAPPGLVNNFAVAGGTGAFLGARGMLMSPPFTSRFASTEEDPANRRINGGGRGRQIYYLIPLSLPEIVTTTAGAAVFHADFSPVTSSSPARVGETLIIRATGLGPTRPGLPPGATFPESPFHEVNSPLEVTVNGRAAEVVNKVGWPGTTNIYRLDIRVPDGIEPGIAALQVTAAFIPGREVSIPLQ